MKKRQFLKQLGHAALVTPFLPLNLRASEAIGSSPYPIEEDEFWERIREDYNLKPDYINLENGYYNFVPKPKVRRVMTQQRAMIFSWF